MKKTKKQLLVPGEENFLTGKQLIEMGKRTTSDGSLIASGLKYSVWINPPHLGGWQIKVKP